MKATGIQQQTVTMVQTPQIETIPAAPEPQKPVEKSQPERPEQMKSQQQHATERRSDTQMDAQLRRMQLEGSVGSKAALASNFLPIREKLTYGPNNLMIDNADVADVHSQLQKLSPQEYKATIEQMNRDGLLGRYINNMDGDSLKAFLGQAVDSGYIQKEQAPATIQGKFDPPTPPGLLKNDKHLPTPIRETIHQDNLNNAAGYYRNYGQYISRYNHAVHQAKSGEEIRALGAPANRQSLSEPGVMKGKGELDYSRFTKDWYNTLAVFPSESRGYQAISDRMHDLTGAKRAGSVWLTADLEVGAEKELDREAKGKISNKRHFEISNYGGTVSQVEAGAQLSSETRGIQFGGAVGTTVMTAPNGIRHESKDQVSTSKGFEYKGAGYSVGNDGTVEGSFAFPEAPHGYAKFAKDGYMEIGVGKSFESGDAKAQIRFGLGIQGSSAERAVDAATGDVGTFGTPKELEQGMSWKALAQNRRAYFERSLGWTEAEWNKRLADRQK